MSESDQNAFEQTERLLDEEDAETLAAIDRGLKAVKEERVFSADDARRRIEAWTTKSSTPKTR